MPLKATLYTALLYLSATVLSASTLVWDRTEASIELEPGQEEARASYTVTNQGDQAVRIARVKSSCGCTGSIVDRKIIQPGESAEIVGTFNKGKRQGLNRNRLQVFIDSQKEAVATLKMNVQIPTLIEAMPQIVYWNANSAKTERRVRIQLDERYINDISRLEYDRSKITLTQEVNEDPNSDADYVLIIEPKTYAELYRGSITIHGTGPDGNKGETRVHTFVQP